MIGPCDVLDVSEAQSSPIDWPRVAQSVRHVIVRACYGTRVDTMAQHHADNAHHVGLTVSLYGYLRPQEPATPQAELLAKLTHELAAEGAPWEDLEEAGGLDADRLAAHLMTALVTCDAQIADLRMRTGIYTGPAFWQSSIKSHTTEFRKRALWLAHYGASRPSIPDRWIDCLMHQHSANTIVRLPDGSQRFGPSSRDLPGAIVIAEPGHVDGVPGECDVSSLRGSIDDLLAGRNPATVPDLATTLGRQQALRLLGHDPGHLDGLWGSSSRAALVLTQRALGLNPDAVWGGNTSTAVALALEDLAAG